MLFNPERHFALLDEKWNERLAQDFADEIFATTNEAYSSSAHWPAHPLDRPDPRYLTTMYMGIEGVAWTLHRWALASGAVLKFDPVQVIEISLGAQKDQSPSYFFGETGARMALRSVTDAPKPSASLLAALKRLRESPTNEIMAGAPGALIAAQLEWEKHPTEDLRLFILSVVEQMFSTWTIHPETQLPLWRQEYGGPVLYFGAAHGTVGNIFALLRASTHLTEEERRTVHERAIQILKGLAVREGNEANWPTRAWAGSPERLVQWCHGAPGILMQLAALLPKGADPELDELFIEAGRLIWRAGALKKGASLCHGTTGSGAALLKLFERTQDEIWLERARSFAMTAIPQIKEARSQYGQLRYSLWTADIGSALFLTACADGAFAVPMLDEI